ncbi:MAG: 4Fe-4S binding protein, partial [Candidatus Aminicenantes bacterium]|nr:4Fe-4S binding protein [Candidatus Aminicenantes bacterium]
DEYPLAVKHIFLAISQAEKLGLLGEKILGTDFNFRIHVSKGAGAFVCGEETALIASVEGRVGEPRQRPPFPAIKGLWKKPTNINNVETWANIPLIVEKGADWFSKIGTKGSKGTKIFSLVGKINNTGLVEVPMGITLREVIFDIGGGIPGGKEFKAVQTGGPSGGCLPKDRLDLSIDYEGLTEAGSIMGSGGMIVMDENTCMVDVAKYFLNFLRDESCGKCLSCREGTQRMWEIVTEISEGKGKEEDIRLLEELAHATKDASLCGLGQTAANPVLSTLRYFRDEYIAHVKDKTCPAGVCKELITYSILEDKCTGCLACIKVCPQEAISGELKKVHVLDQEKCIKCGACFEVCQFDAIKIK